MKRQRPLLVLAFLFLAAPLFGGNYYVSKTGSDAHACSNTDSAGTNKLTIAAGKLCQSSGDKLLVHTGTYVEIFDDGSPWTNGSMGSPTVVSAYPDGCGFTGFVIGSTPSSTCEVVTVAPTSGNHVFAIGGYTYITINGFRINMTGTNPTSNPSSVGIKIQSASTHIVATNNEIFNGGNGIHFTDAGSDNNTARANYLHTLAGPFSPPFTAFYNGENNNDVDGNYVEDVIGECIQLYSGRTGHSPTSNIVRNNLFAHCNHGTDGSESGIIVGNVSGTTLVYNNVVVGTYGDHFGAGISLCCGGTGATVAYNTIYGNHWFGINIDPGWNGAVVKGNILFNNGGTIQNQGSGTSQQDNPTGDPQFTNAAGNDYSLKSTSPVRDSITCISSVTVLDIIGTTRPTGSQCEPGAYEFVPSGVAPLQVYVSPTIGVGSDSNTGTSTGSPFLTLNKGLQTISSKGTVNVCAGACDGTGSAIIDAAIDDTVQAPASGDSTQSTIIRPYAGETITLRPSTGCTVVNLTNATTYISVKNMILDAGSLSCAGTGTVTRDHLDAYSTAIVGSSETFPSFGPIGNNSNRILVDMIGSQVFKNSLTSVTFNGTSLTRYAADDADSHGGGFAAMEAWYQLAPTVTTANMVANFNRDDAQGSQTGFSLSGVNQTTPFRNSTVTGGNSGTSANLTITTVANDLVIACIQLRNGGMNPGTITVTTGTQVEQVNDGSSLSYTCSYLVATGVSTTMSYTWGPASNFAAVALAVEPASTSTTVTVVNVGASATNFTLDNTEAKNSANSGVAVASTGFSMHGGSVHNTGTLTTDIALRLTGTSAVVDSSADIYSNAGIAASVEANTGSILASSFHSNGGACTIQTSGSITGLKVYNNLVYLNTGKGICLTANAPTGGAVHHNTVYLNSDRGIHVTAGSGHLIKNNLAYLNTTADVTVSAGTETNNLTATNPLFVNAPLDFHLGAGSLAIDYGTSLADPLIDKDGLTRPLGTAPDAGAYETNSTSLPRFLNIFSSPGIR